MAIPNRTVAITGVFAEDATTPVPLTPVAGVSYRDTSMTETDVKEGWAYKTIVDSGKFNQALYEYASITKQLEEYGFLPWSSLTDYVQGSLCLGSDGVIYQAKQATGPSSTAYDPVNDTAHTYWEDFVGNTYVTKATAQTITGNKTFTGNVALDGTVSAGSTARATFVNWGIPDTSRATSITLPYTTTEDCYIAFKHTGNSPSSQVGNGIVVDSLYGCASTNGVFGASDKPVMYGGLYVASGSTVEATSSSGTYEVWMIPLKGIQ